MELKKIVIKIILILLHLFYGFFFSLYILYVNKNPKKKFIKSWSSTLLKILNINLNVDKDINNILSSNNYLIVSNHISWLDIFLINSIYPVTFLSKASVASWPLIGPLTKSADTIFIDRKKLSAIKDSADQIEYNLKKTGSVYFFPEGTASDGSYLLPFKSNLFQTAINTNKNILPICIQYTYQNKFTKAPSYCGDMSLLKSLLNLIRLKNISAKLTILPTIKCKQSRKDLAQKAYLKINQALNY